MPALEYTLGLKTQDFDRGIKNADAETKVFSQSLSRMGVVGENAGRTVSTGFHELREGAHGAKEGMQALTGATELLGYQVAPEATLAVRTLYESIKALQAAGRLTELSFAGLGVAGIGLAAALATVVSGYQAIDAELKEIESEDALEKQYETLKDKLIPQIEKYIKLGRIDRKTGTGLINQLIDSNTPDRQRNALRNAQKEVGGVEAGNRKVTAGQSLDQLLKIQGFGLLSDRDREKEEFKMGRDEEYLKALDLAKKAGRNEKPITDLFNQVTQTGLKKIDDKFADKKEPKLDHFRESPVTMLQKIGLVFRGGASSDPMQQTARHTRETAQGIKELVAHVKQNGPGPLGDPLANDSAT